MTCNYVLRWIKKYFLRDDNNHNFTATKQKSYRAITMITIIYYTVLSSCSWVLFFFLSSGDDDGGTLDTHRDTHDDDNDDER